MVEVVGALAVPIGKLLLKATLGAEAADVGGSLFQLALKRLGDRQKAGEAARKAEAVGRSVATDLGQFLAGERADPAEVEAAVNELATTIEGHVDAKLLVGQQLDPGLIARAILDARTVDQVFRPAEPANGYYRQLVAALAPRLRAVADALPSYVVERDAEFLAKLDALSRTTPEILAGVGEIGERQRAEEARRRGETDTHEDLYRRALERQVRQVTLFGVDLDPHTPRDLPLSIAYIPLKLRVAGEGEALDYAELLTLLPLLGNRLLIEGAAGSGKTTLVQWTALEALLVQAGTKPVPPTLGRLIESRTDLLEGLAKVVPGLTDSHLRGLLGLKRHVTGAGRGLREASPEFAGEAGPLSLATLRGGKPWHGRTPFLVRLRLCPDGRLPEPAGLPGLIAHGAGAAPEDWVRWKLLSGEALVLLDGIDEVPDAKRRDIRESIANYFGHYLSAQFVVTSRPAAVSDPRWGELFGPCRAAVQPMAPVDIERFVEQWHQALAATGRMAFDTRAVDRLTGEILTASALQQLAGTPLLCAAICYLHRVRTGELPRRLNSLYDMLCELLIHRLDRARFEKEEQERLNRALRGLDFEDKRALLARLAHFMVREEAAVLDAERAATHVGEGLARLRKLAGRDPVEVLDALQERSGVLRGASPTSVEFAHNGLRSFLAAIVYKGEQAYGDIVAKALATDDPDLPVLAAAQGGDNYRDGLIGELSKRAGRTADEDQRRAVYVMAARCGATGPVSAATSGQLGEMERAVLPPENLPEAGQLAELGERALPTLGRSPDQADAVAAACVRCLRLVGGRVTERLLETYLDHEADEVVNELTQGVNPLRVTQVAKAVLDQSRAHERIEPVRHIREDDLSSLDEAIGSLNLGGSRLRSADILRGRFALRTLSLAGTQVADLAPLAGLAGLQQLSLDGTQVADLAPLAGLAGLQQLWLDGTQVADLTPLLGLERLLYLNVLRTQLTPENPILEKLRQRDVNIAV